VATAAGFGPNKVRNMSAQSRQQGRSADNSATVDVHRTGKAILGALVDLRGRLIHSRLARQLGRPQAEIERFEDELSSGIRQLRTILETSKVRPTDVRPLTIAFDGSIAEKVHEGIRGQSYHEIVFKLGESAVESIAESAAYKTFVDAVADWFDVFRIKQERLGQLLDEEFVRATEALSTPNDADLLTVDELALLALVEPKTVLNKLSASRTGSNANCRPPAPAFKGSGQSPDRYSYAAILPWLRSTWATKLSRFLDSIGEARQILSNVPSR
jgi:hypothetical protein